MKTKLIVCLCAAIALSGFPDAMPLNPEKKGLVFMIHSEKNQYSNSEPILIYLLVTNRSENNMVLFRHFAPNWSYKLIVHDSKGEQLPFQPPSPRLLQGYDYYDILFVNEIFGKVLDLTGWEMQYKLKSGLYRIKAVYSPGEKCEIQINPKCESVESNEIEISIR